MDIDTANAALFNPAEWIGTGEENKDMSPCVALARQESTAIVRPTFETSFLGRMRIHNSCEEPYVARHYQ